MVVVPTDVIASKVYRVTMENTSALLSGYLHVFFSLSGCKGYALLRLCCACGRCSR